MIAVLSRPAPRASDWCAAVLASCTLLAACKSTEVKPATQVVFTVTSDLAPGEEITRIDRIVSRRDGTDVVAMDSLSIVARDPVPGQQTLPITFSVGMWKERSFMLALVAYGPSERAGMDEERLIEYKTIVSFEVGRTLHAPVFLGRVCKRDCAVVNRIEQVCYPVARGDTPPGACGPIPIFDPGDAPNDPGTELGSGGQSPMETVPVGPGATFSLIDADVDAPSSTPETGPQVRDTEPPEDLEIAGSWRGEGADEWIDSTRWCVGSSDCDDTTIVTFDNARNVAIVEAAEGLFAKRVWTNPGSGGFFYCTVDWGYGSEDEAAASTRVADDDRPAVGGCRGLPWTRLVPSNGLFP
jgi:hypothetical protein